MVHFCLEQTSWIPQPEERWALKKKKNGAGSEEIYKLGGGGEKAIDMNLQEFQG